MCVLREGCVTSFSPALMGRFRNAPVCGRGQEGVGVVHLSSRALVTALQLIAPSPPNPHSSTDLDDISSQETACVSVSILESTSWGLWPETDAILLYEISHKEGSQSLMRELAKRMQIG